KATKVAGLYDSDPVVNKDARFIKKITYMEVLERQLKVMDMTSISLAMENQLPLVIFDIKNKGNLRKIVCGEEIGTRINN
ncbi:MAG: UMP kinase, partial [Proteobacteria bacterium]|nr:UMP kinase [Pseudomonadota bacterium]